jgi:thymidylate synthase (FAD)
LVLQVLLLGYVNDTERIAAACVKATRQKESAADLFDQVDLESAREYLGRVLPRGHEGIAEFSYFIFSVSGISRVLTHQLVRHRIASYLQMSSRDIDLSSTGFVMPPEIAKDHATKKAFLESIKNSCDSYRDLIEKGIHYEDARYLLPDGIETHIAIAMNARSLNHFFGMRLCTRAQWEIRDLAKQMRKLVRSIAPSLFWSEPRPCVIRGYCPEGKNSCGFYKTEEFNKEKKRYDKGYPHE